MEKQFFSLVLITGGLLTGYTARSMVLILSSMEAAFNSLVAASSFDLDMDMANSCRLISTLSLSLVISRLYWLLGIFWLDEPCNYHF